MLELLKNKPDIVVEAQKARFRPNLAVQVLIFIAVFIVTQIAAGLPVAIGAIIKVVADISSGRADFTNPADSMNYAREMMSVNWFSLLTLFCTIIVTILVIVYCRFIEKRSLYSMGFVKRKAVFNYLLGLVIGAVMFGAGVLICWLTGALAFNGVILGNSLGLVFAFFLAFLFQGMSEEVMLRGYFMVSIAAKKTVVVAILLNSILFALMHILNNGISLLPVINLTLFGIFASVYMLRTGNIWGVCAIHSMWNFVQGNIFGIAVSGINIKASVFSFVPAGTGTLINGGDFGLEGGLGVTIVLVAAIIITLLAGAGKNQSSSDIMSESQI
ncbi:CPBP family intramembrane glutamic endopeptidase [Ruminiclostridium cellobioparum]|uniref:CAAX amino terminal protease family n=1 Tax=Ruminiclostridium cellobioparum subsp. termitidis CT1112 TaxID=1195236 RepID=S0FI34_RUMCE|nr:CPBP family intramembrane glutamic endopeptidase [Ruminiclostridium cellobioparum]EMS69691.1 CAAX amino terminal protease family [Ruminiclostridium cellobioparum subsp. termitidis CT1112]